MKKFFLPVFIICFFVAIPGLAQEPVSTIGIADTNRFGNLTLYNLEGWRFSYDDPAHIKSRPTLPNTIPVDLSNFQELKSNPNWNNYGWFELEFIADSSIAGLPWILSYLNQEPVRIWLNGKEILKNGNPSREKENEVLARFVNPVQTGIILQEGRNFLLIEYSDHTRPEGIGLFQRLEYGIFLILYKNYEPFLRRQRAFLFGGSVMLLLLLVVIHTFLAVKFKGQYHTYVALTTFAMLILAFASLSDTLIDWNYSYLYFHESIYAVSLALIACFFLISTRMIFELEVPWKSLTALCVLSVVVGLIFVFIDRTWVNLLHAVIVLSTFTYTIYSFWEVKKKNPQAKVWILGSGLTITVVGSILYVIPYLVFGSQSNALFLFSVLCSFTGVPISLTFNVASNYASLITTLETKVKDRTAALESANEYQKRFFANISHEFRTPLTISEGLINKLMRKEDLNQITTKADLSVIKRNMNRLHNMVDQIIDLTKSEQNHLALHQDYYKADNLAAISVESFRSLAEYHGHNFQFKPGAQNAVLYADRTKVEVMINNLISNAIKFTPQDGSIEIETSTEEGQFVLTVKDSGPGIPPGKEEVIFERFHRLSRPEEEYVEGMGVGLELSQMLAKLHGGTIEAVSGVEQGALFKLTLPLVDAEEVSLVQLLDIEEENMLYQEVPYAEISNDKFDILLVEDNEDMRDYVADILSEIGDITSAHNGKEALKVLTGYTPDIIITDLMMPEMGGHKLVEHLFASKKWANIPVIVLTAKALEDDKLHLLRYGVVDYITKPFQPEQLLLKTRNLLTYYNRRKKLKIDLSLEEVPAKEDRLSEKAAAFIMKNLSDTNLSVDSLSEEFSQSRSTFYRNIQLETGMSPAELIREVRLTAARTMVAENKNLRLEELANAVGYKSATSFRKKYEERFGVHPLGNL